MRRGANHLTGQFIYVNNETLIKLKEINISITNWIQRPLGRLSGIVTRHLKVNKFLRKLTRAGSMTIKLSTNHYLYEYGKSYFVGMIMMLLRHSLWSNRSDFFKEKFDTFWHADLLTSLMARLSKMSINLPMFFFNCFDVYRSKNWVCRHQHPFPVKIIIF